VPLRTSRAILRAHRVQISDLLNATKSAGRPLPGDGVPANESRSIIRSPLPDRGNSDFSVFGCHFALEPRIDEWSDQTLIHRSQRLELASELLP